MTAPFQYAPFTHNQAMDRRDRVLKDQHGRPWLTAIEIKSFDSTGGFQAAGWTDPLRTPQQFLRIPIDQFGNQQIGDCKVNWDGWINHQKEALDRWKEWFWFVCKTNKIKPKDAEKDEYIMYEAGPKPWPSMDILNKAKAGDRQLLGLEPLTADYRELLGLETLEDLEKKFAEDTAPERQLQKPTTQTVTTAEPTWQDFASLCLKEGKTMAEAGQMWREFKGKGA